MIDVCVPPSQAKHTHTHTHTNTNTNTNTHLHTRQRVSESYPPAKVLWTKHVLNHPTKSNKRLWRYFMHWSCVQVEYLAIHKWVSVWVIFKNKQTNNITSTFSGLSCHTNSKCSRTQRRNSDVWGWICANLSLTNSSGFTFASVIFFACVCAAWLKRGLGMIELQLMQKNPANPVKVNNYHHNW